MSLMQLFSSSAKIRRANLESYRKGFYPTRLSCPIILQALPIRLSCNKVLESRELENAFKSHSCSSRNFVEKRGIRIPGATRVQKRSLYHSRD